MSSKFFSAADRELLLWVTNLVSVAKDNHNELGLNNSDLAPVEIILRELEHKVSTIKEKKEELHCLVEKKEEVKSDLVSKLTLLMNKINANPKVNGSLKNELGLSSDIVISSDPLPIAPSELIAIQLSDGSVELDWSRNGNDSRTQFVIEAKIGKAFPTWILVDVVKKTSYIHTGFPPGTQVQYVVRARRGEITSRPSNIAITDIGVS